MVFIFIEEVSAHGGIFLREDYQAIALAEFGNRDDELTGFIATLLLLLLFLLWFGLRMQIPHRVGLLNLTTQYKLDTHLMFPASLQPRSLLGVGLEFLLEIGAEIGLREIRAIDSIEVGVGVGIEYFGVGEAVEVLLLGLGFAFCEGAAHS